MALNLVSRLAALIDTVEKDQRSSTAHSHDGGFSEPGTGRSSSVVSAPMSTQSFGSTSTVAPPSWKWQRRFVALEANGVGLDRKQFHALVKQLKAVVAVS